MNPPDEKSKELPLYALRYPGVEKPRVVAARNKRAARSHCAKSFVIETVGAREAFELAKQGVAIEVAGSKAP